MNLQNTAETYMQRLCLEIPTRRVGTAGNKQATDFFASVITNFGFEIESPTFDCIDWTHGDVHLTVEGATFEAYISPYSLSCQIKAPLCDISTLEALEVADSSNKILLLHGKIAQEQLMPKNFPFYNPDHHKRIIHLLEAKKPLAIIAATSRDAEMTGGVYPFPLIEDGDFDIPSVYMTDKEGDRLSRYIGDQVSLEFQAERIPSTGSNVIARKGADSSRRVVLLAHIDAKDGTPGAVDNATGVTVLLLLAELLVGYSGNLGIEIIAINGEDYYSAPGERLFLDTNKDRFDEFLLGINLDGVGYIQGKTAYSIYDCPPDLTSSIHQVFSNHKNLIEGDPWFQGDHGLFLLNQVPALALTSQRFTHIWAEIAHTSKDTPEIVDATKLIYAASAISDLLIALDQGIG